MKIKPALHQPTVEPLKQVPGALDPYSVLGNNDSARDVAGTALSVLAPLATFSALNDRTSRKVSPLWPLEGPRRWMVLVRDDRLAATVEGVHSFVVDMLAEEALSLLVGEGWRFHAVGDEIRAYQPLKCITEVARRGRKSATCLTLTLHEISGFQERYGDKAAQEILSLMAFKVFLRTGGIDTAEWGKNAMGTPETLVDIPPRGPQGGNWQRQISMRDNVIPDEIRRCLRDASFEDDRIEGYIDFPSLTARFECPFRDDVVVPMEPLSLRTFWLSTLVS